MLLYHLNQNNNKILLLIALIDAPFKISRTTETNCRIY